MGDPILSGGWAELSGQTHTVIKSLKDMVSHNDTCGLRCTQNTLQWNLQLKDTSETALYSGTSN